MHALLKVLFASIYFSDKTHASNEKVKDKDLECTVKEKKEFQQVQGSLKNGKLNGFVKMYGRYTVDPKGHCSNMVFPGLSFFGWYENGKPTGPCWRKLIGSNYIHGTVDKDGEFTGDDIAYVYQDLELALVGTFHKGIMINGQEANVISSTCNENGIRVLKFTKPHGPVFHYERPTNISFGDQPHINDPLDQKYVYLKQSTLEFAGQGLYAAKDIPANIHFVNYGGYLYDKKQYDLWLQPLMKKKEENGWILDEPLWHKEFQYQTNMFANPNDAAEKTFLGDQNCFRKINIPPDVGSTEKYQGTLGHKVNHNFDATIKPERTESARFGLIISYKTTVPIKQGEEIFVNYGFPIKDAPKWYRDMYKKFAKENPSKKDNEILKEIRFLEHMKAQHETLIDLQWVKDLVNFEKT